MSQDIDGEILSDALLNYVSSGEFRESVDEFFTSHHRGFKTGMEDVRDQRTHTHRHYEVWRDFQLLVECLIDSALAVIGGSVESLERRLQRLCGQQPSGPKQATVQELIERLLSYHRWAYQSVLRSRD
jgi:hypothetical protein